ncbi:MAG: glycosyltransferase [Acidimicrobiia bacterium]|nr:glycosyltransferase [Acidimicrobiia bacterium]
MELSVVVPAFNAAETIGEQLEALAAQITQLDAEVVVVDNRSTDATADIVRRRAATAPWLRLVSAPDRAGPGHARNVGVAHARADRIAFCDSDDIVADGWVRTMVDSLGRHELVTGLLELDELNDSDGGTQRGSPRTDAASYYGLFPYVASGNCAVRRTTFEGLGGFDEDLDACEDIELSLRARLAGIVVGFDPAAIVHYRYRHRPSELFRQGRSYGRGRVDIARRMKLAGLERPSWYAGWKSWLWLAVNAPRAATGRGRRAVAWVAGNRLGHLEASVRTGVVLL